MPHPLEIAILDAAYATPVDTTLIKTNLQLMIEQEIYLTIRDNSGNTVDDVIFERVGSPLLRKVLENYNANIDKIKKQRLNFFLDQIHAHHLIGLKELITYQNNHSPLTSEDLTFLLTKAIQANTPLDIISFLIDSGANCNGLGTSGRRPIYLAVEQNNLAVIDLLFRKGALLTTQDTQHKNILHNALAERHYDLLIHLVKDYQCDPNVLDYDQNSLLHTAILAGDREQVRFCLRLGTDPTLMNRDDQTPLDLASAGAQYGYDCLNSMFTPKYHKQEVRSARNLIASDLRQAIAEKNRIARIFKNIQHIRDGYLHLSAHDINDQDIPLLITRLDTIPFIQSIDLSNNPLTSVGADRLVAYLIDRTWVVDLFLTSCSISDYILGEYNQALHPDERLKKLLSSYGAEEPLEIVQLLINKGTKFENAEEEGWYLWHYAAYHGHLNVINTLMAHKVDITKEINDEFDKRNCVHLAAESKHIEILGILLTTGLFLVDKKNASNKNGLMTSLDNHSLEGMALFLEHGANPREFFSQQVLLDLAIDSFPASVSLLLSRGAKLTKNAHQILAAPDAEENPAYSPLFEWRRKELSLCDAVRKNQFNTVKNFIEKDRIDVNCVDATDSSPFKLAMDNEYWEIASFFLYVDPTLLETFRQCTKKEEENLYQHFLSYQTRDVDAPIYFLRSRTVYCDAKQVGETHKIIDIYRDLYGIDTDDFTEYTRPLLQVIEHLPNLSIIYDPVAIDTKRANILSEEGTRGSFSRTICGLVKIVGIPTNDNLPNVDKPLYILTENSIYYRDKKKDTPKEIALEQNKFQELAKLFNENIPIDLSMTQLQQITKITGHSVQFTHTIYIAGRPAENYAAVRGTIIHEICHAVCYFLWKNECEPFFASSDKEHEFNAIYEKIYAEFVDKDKRSNLDIIVQEVFSYPPEKYKRELIVRVPQIIATHGLVYTKNLCEKSDGFKALFEYYVDYVLPQAKQYLKSTPLYHDNTNTENHLQIACARMTIKTPSPLLLQQEAVIKLQALFRGWLQRTTLTNLSIMGKCCNELIDLLDSIGAHEAVAPTKSKIIEKTFLSWMKSILCFLGTKRVKSC